MVKKNNLKRKINRKGDTALYFVLLGVLIFAITFLLYMGKMENNLQKVGENTLKVVNTFEMSERLLFYTDVSTELAAKNAREQILADSGYLQEKFKGQIQNSGCGTLAYPIIDADKVSASPKGINECFPDYENAFRISFTRNLNKLLLNYDPFEIDPSNFYTITKKESGGITVEVQVLSDMTLPIYSYIESYYRDADKTLTSKETPNTLTKTSEGYFTQRAYSLLNSFSRDGTTPTKIVIHDTKTSSVQETFLELQTGLKNYNYVIDTTGEIYLFVPEEKYTRHSDCAKGISQSTTCIMENTDKESISIALVNKPSSSSHDKNQINSLIKLISDISIRNPTIQIDNQGIVLNSEIDSSRINDPAQDLSSAKSQILIKANTQKSQEVIQPSALAGDVPEGTISTPLRSIQVYAVNVPDVDDEKCFSSIRTTLYYTPEIEDHGGIWSSNENPCPNSYGYCCIPQSKRGFYEDVMCQGSGVASGLVYHYTKISKQGLSQSIPLSSSEYTRGITSRGKDPTPKRTVAADPNCPGFNYGSKLYIYWGENNPWNGYYVVEDTGGAFKGRCDKLDIYAGVGKKELSEAAKYVSDYGKVCVLEDDFQMPDPDFSGSSTFVDPTSGEYNVNYVHSVNIPEITNLFDKTKQAISQIITKCGKLSDQTQKDACIEQEMKNGYSIYSLNMTYCDSQVKERIWTTEDVSKDMPLILAEFEKDYKIMVTIKQVNANNMDLFSAITQQNTGMIQSPVALFTQSPEYALVTVVDESGTELKINLSKGAVEWVDYMNKESVLFESKSFLRAGSKVLMKVTKVKNSTYDGYHITDFKEISSYPEEILDEEIINFAKKIAECATSGDECVCKTEPTRMLGEINIKGNQFKSSFNDEVEISVPFTVSQSTNVDTSNVQRFTINHNSVTLLPQGSTSSLPECIPKKKYVYICSSLKDKEEIGTIGYALKI